MFRAQSHTGTVVQPESSSRPLFWRHFQTFPTPDSLHPILAYRPACVPPLRRDSSIAVPPVLRRQSDYRPGQIILVQSMNRLVSLRPPPLPQQSAGVPFRQAILPPCPLHRTTSPLRAQKFPGATSCKTCFSSSQASSTVFSQLFPFVAITRFWGVCFRSQRLRLARLMGEFPDGFLTVVAARPCSTGCTARCCSDSFRVAIARLVVRARFVEPGNLLSLTTTICLGVLSEAIVTALYFLLRLCKYSPRATSSWAVSWSAVERPRGPITFFTEST